VRHHKEEDKSTQPKGKTVRLHALIAPAFLVTISVTVIRWHCDILRKGSPVVIEDSRHMTDHSPRGGFAFGVNMAKPCEVGPLGDTHKSAPNLVCRLVPVEQMVQRPQSGGQYRCHRRTFDDVGTQDPHMSELPEMH